MKRITPYTIAKRIARDLVLLFVIGASIGPMRASAQEDLISPPPPLQWPTSVSANPDVHLAFQLGTSGLRHTIEEAADLTLCKTLMKDANLPIPTDPPLTYATCPSSIKAMIDARQGSVAWAEGARPTECKRKCLGPPFMSQSQNVDRPNSRYALVYGTLTFKVNVPLPLLPGSVDRNVIYFVEVDANCDIPGTRAGTVKITTHVDGPVADDPGFLESVLNYLALPLELSSRIDDGIKDTYHASTSSGPGQGPCSSMGASASPPDFSQGDEFVWDVPKPPRRPAMLEGAAVKPTATIYFDRIIRNHTIESNPSPAPLTFTAYINGMPAHIPKNGTISLSPGARNEQKYCKTISTEGLDSLQILFVDSLGGAVWSQFTPGQNFGGGAHKMTTGRTYLTPGLHPGDKPQKFVLQEFELDYRVDYHPMPTAIGSATTPAAGGRPVRPRPHGGVVVLGDQPPPGSSCTKI